MPDIDVATSHMFNLTGIYSEEWFIFFRFSVSSKIFMISLRAWSCWSYIELSIYTSIDLLMPAQALPNASVKTLKTCKISHSTKPHSQRLALYSVAVWLLYSEVHTHPSNQATRFGIKPRTPSLKGEEANRYHAGLALLVSSSCCRWWFYNCTRARPSAPYANDIARSQSTCCILREPWVFPDLKPYGYSRPSELYLSK